MFKLTEITGVTNTGARTRIRRFYTWNELQDYLDGVTAGMTPENAELYLYNCKIEEL